jgi:hypothetical protein
MKCTGQKYSCRFPTSARIKSTATTIGWMISKIKHLGELCKIWGFHGADYEECCLLGYKNPVHTSQETHYLSATDPNRLMICKIWGFHGADYEEWCLLGYKNPVLTSQETHYVSATEPKRLMLCTIWGFDSGDYEECRLLGYKNPVRTSQETHYVSATEPSRLMLYKIWSFHGCESEECRLLGCDVVWLLQEPTSLRNVSSCKSHMVSHSRRQHSSEQAVFFHYTFARNL